MFNAIRMFVGASLVLFYAGAFADDCHLQISGNDALQFDQRKLVVPAHCAEVELTLTHIGKSAAKIMGHNWILSKTSDVTAITSAGAEAGFEQNYQPVGDARIIAATKIVGGGESTTIKFSTAALSPGDDYTYFCSFPGHSSMMKGKFLFGAPPG